VLQRVGISELVADEGDRYKVSKTDRPLWGKFLRGGGLSLETAASAGRSGDTKEGDTVEAEDIVAGEYTVCVYI